MAVSPCSLPVLQIDVPKNPAALSDVIPLLERLDAAFADPPAWPTPQGRARNDHEPAQAPPQTKQRLGTAHHGVA